MSPEVNKLKKQSYAENNPQSQRDALTTMYNTILILLIPLRPITSNIRTYLIIAYHTIA